MADFTTVMTSTAEVDDSIIKEFDQQFIVAHGENGIMDQFAQYRRGISGKSIEFQKYSRLDLATTPLLEKEDLDSVALADEQIIITPQEYGNVVTKTELARLQSGGNKLDLACARVVGLNAGSSVDKLAMLSVEGSANVLHADGSGSDASIEATDTATPSFLNKLYSELRRRKVPAFMDGMYVAVMHSDVIHDLRASTGTGSWQDILKGTQPDRIFRNQVGMLAGFIIVEDNHALLNEDAGTGGTVDVYNINCLGFNAFGKAESNPLQMVMSGPFDKLSRFVNVGWKWTGNYGIVDTDSVQIGRVASSIGANA